MSTVARLGGVRSLVGGVDPSDKPDDPAVDGRPSPESFVTDLFRAGTPSGQVHCRSRSVNYFSDPVARTHVRLVGHVYTACSLASPRHTIRVFSRPYTSKGLGPTFIFLTRHVKHPVLLRVYLGRLERCAGSVRCEESATCA
jgi:hypothetical protein